MTPEIILEFVRELAPADSAIALETSLFDGRLLDSLQLMELISFLEKEFAIRVEPAEIVLDNLDSVEKMMGLIARKRA